MARRGNPVPAKDTGNSRCTTSVSCNGCCNVNDWLLRLCSVLCELICFGSSGHAVFFTASLSDTMAMNSPLVGLSSRANTR